MLAFAFPVFVATALSLSPALANHFFCNWDGPGADVPEKYNYERYCSAIQTWADDTHATYTCELSGVKVADWGYLQEGVLEIATPCNGGGYGDKHECSSHNWAACVNLSNVNSTHKVNLFPWKCYYFSRHDDCQWPTAFTKSELPETVVIYRDE